MVIYQEVLALVGHDEELVSKFHKFKRNAALARNPNARWCPKYAFCFVYASFICLVMHFHEFNMRLSKQVSISILNLLCVCKLPRPGCETAIIGSPENPKICCEKCHTYICFSCNQIVFMSTLFIFVPFFWFALHIHIETWC